MDKIIFDTDIGDDIDDAIALKFLLPFDGDKIEILGVTTAFKAPLERAKLASAILRESGKNIPVFVGEKGNTQDDGFKVIQYFDSMADEKTENKPAVDFILETAEKYPGEVTLLSLAPLCNLQKAYEKNPESFCKLKRIVMMGGCYSYPFAEWNIRCDSEAAQTVFSSPVQIVTVGIDVTKESVLTEKEIAEILSVNGIGVVGKAMQEYMNVTGRTPTMHDPLTAGVLVEDFVRFEKKKFRLGTDGAEKAKFFESDDGKEMSVAVKADIQGFKKYMIKTMEVGKR